MPNTKNYGFKRTDIAELSEKYSVSELTNCAKTTRNNIHIEVLSTSKNLSILMAVVQNKIITDKLLKKIALDNLNCPPLLQLISNNNNCSKMTGNQISWELFQRQITHRNSRKVM